MLCVCLCVRARLCVCARVRVCVCQVRLDLNAVLAGAVPLTFEGRCVCARARMCVCSVGVTVPFTLRAGVCACWRSLAPSLAPSLPRSLALSHARTRALSGRADAVAGGG